jgi:hypothetical protein
MGAKRNAYYIFVGKREGKRPLATRVSNITMDRREIGQDEQWRALVNTVMNLRVP